MSSTQTRPRYLSMNMLQQLYLPYRHAYLSLYQVLSRQSRYFSYHIFCTYFISMNNYCYHDRLCNIYYHYFNLYLFSYLQLHITVLTYISILHIVISFSINLFCLSYIMNASMRSCIHIFIYSFLYSYLFISFAYSYHVFIYSYTFYISIMYALTYSHIHICTYHSCTCTHSYALSSFAYFYCSYHLCLSTMCS